MTPQPVIRPEWFKSSYSSANGTCVETSYRHEEFVATRDSKVPGGPVLTFRRAGFAAFLAELGR